MKPSECLAKDTDGEESKIIEAGKGASER